jgi:hypothetical protein
MTKLNVQQSAINWFVEKLNQCEPWYSGANVPHEHINKLIEQAKQIDRQQRINSQMDMFLHMSKFEYILDYDEKVTEAKRFADEYEIKQIIMNSTNDQIKDLTDTDGNPPVMRCFAIAYSFDNHSCYTCEQFHGVDEDDCRERFWKDRPTANQIHFIEERF